MSEPTQFAPFPWATMALVGLISAGLGAFGAWNFRPPEKSRVVPITTAVAPAEPPASTPPMLSDAVSLGNWNYDHQQWAEAARAYEQAIAGGVDNPDVRTDLGNCYRFLGSPQKALAQYEIAQRQNPQHENSLLNEAAIYANVLHAHAKAEQTVGEFLQRFPKSASASAARQLLVPTATPAP